MSVRARASSFVSGLIVVEGIGSSGRVIGVDGNFASAVVTGGGVAKSESVFARLGGVAVIGVRRRFPAGTTFCAGTSTMGARADFRIAAGGVVAGSFRFVKATTGVFAFGSIRGGAAFGATGLRGGPALAPGVGLTVDDRTDGSAFALGALAAGALAAGALAVGAFARAGGPSARFFAAERGAALGVVAPARSFPCFSPPSRFSGLPGVSDF